MSISPNHNTALLIAMMMLVELEKEDTFEFNTQGDWSLKFP
jgi:hypothetical protein